MSRDVTDTAPGLSPPSKAVKTLSPEAMSLLITKVMENPLRRAAQNAGTRSDHSELLIDRQRSVSYNHNYAVTVSRASPGFVREGTLSR